MYEMVFELREFLAEHVYTCLFTNFYFEHAGQRLNEYSELSELDLVSNPRIIMKPGKLAFSVFNKSSGCIWVLLWCLTFVSIVTDKYDERSAHTHIKRLIDVLEKPPVLSIATSGPEEPATTPRSRSASQASANASNAQDGSEMPDKESKEVTMASQEETKADPS